MMTPYQQELKNMKLISHHDLNGYGNGGEGVALQQLPDGRRIFWIAHESAPKDLTALDVSDLASPKVVLQTELPYPYLRSNSLALYEDLLLVAYQANKPGLPGVGMGVYDVSRPERPMQISFFDTSGPYSRGVHCLWFVDGAYAHLSTGAADFQPRHPLDDQFYMIVDMQNPARPSEVGRWWLAGTREGDQASPPARHPRFDSGYRVHNSNVYPQRPDRAYAGWLDAGFLTLDISDMARPKMISRIDHHPPFAGFTHTVLPLFSRDLLVVTDEANPGFEHCEDYPKLAWLVDVRVETNPVMIGSLPLPEKEDFGNRPGRFGAHNIHENQPLPLSFQSDELVFGAFFNAGVRVYDIKNPYQPKEVAHFVPQVPPTARANSVNDVYVDENRIIYAVDRLKGGLYILEMTI
jgi:hypothetical protein